MELRKHPQMTWQAVPTGHQSGLDPMAHRTLCQRVKSVFLREWKLPTRA
ncbi:MAG TPA: hypothetical protein VI585_01770 [Candidatus Binatia bacterium]